MRISSLILIGLLSYINLMAQTDTMSQFYWQNNNLQTERIEREHFPLDSKTACMTPFRQDLLFGFVEKTGKLVIEPAYSLAVGGSYPIPYLIIPEFKGGFAYIKAFKGYIDRKEKVFFAGEQLQDHYDLVINAVIESRETSNMRER